MSSPWGVICWCFLALAVWHVSAIENPSTKDKNDDKYLSDEEAVQYIKDHPNSVKTYDFVPMDLAASSLTDGRGLSEDFDDRRSSQDNRRPLKRQQSLSAEEKRAFLKRQQSRLAADGRSKHRRQNSGTKLANSPKRSDSQKPKAAVGLNKSPSLKSASLSRSGTFKKPGNSQWRPSSPRRAAAPAA